MAKDEPLEIEGVIKEKCPHAFFIVELENGHRVMAAPSGKMRQNKIRLIVGDAVTVELSPYDLTRGRIIWRNK